MKILVVGYGSIGKRHVSNLLDNTKAEIIIYTKRKKLKFSSKNVKIIDSLDKALKENPTIGFITNETAYHIPIAIKLARAGLDLFIEKPLSNSTKGIKTLQRIVKEKKLIVQMGFHMRYHKCILKIHELLEQKKIGKIISGQVENASYLPDWHPYEDYRKGYAAKDKLGGGIVLTQIHEIDYLYWFFGKPRSIYSVTGKFSDLEISADDYSSSIIKFKKNITTEMHLDFFLGHEYKRCKIKGTKGIIFWNSVYNEVKFFDSKKKNWKIILKLKNFKRNDMYVDEIKYFLKCVKNRKKPMNSLDEGIDTMEIALNIIKSGRTKKVVEMK